ncbi:unnamed protein product, partial [Prorocentrum cordatum]
EWHDCVYFSVITITTVGLGDVAPRRPSARAATGLAMLFGVPLFGSALGACVEALRAGAAPPTGSRPPSPAGLGLGLGPDWEALEAFRVQLRRGLRPPPSPAGRDELLAYALVRRGIVSMSGAQALWDECSGVPAELDPSLLPGSGTGKFRLRSVRDRSLKVV